MVTVKLEMTLSLQVIVVALVLSFIIKRDSEVIDYEDAFGKMKTVDYINLKGERFRSSDIRVLGYKRHVSAWTASKDQCL